MQHVPKIFEVLTDRNYGNIKFRGLFEGVLIGSLGNFKSWKVGEDKVVLKGHYTID